MTNAKSLIAYYSRKGNNYVNGRIINLPVGNTKVAAEMIQEITGSDMFEIDTLKPYPLDYTEATKVAADEKRKNFRPELTAVVDNMDSCEVIYLGYPNRWGTFPWLFSHSWSRMIFQERLLFHFVLMKAAE